MAVTYDFQTPGVSTSAADTQEDIRNIAEMSWVWHVNASPHTLTNKPTGLIEAFYDSTVDFTSGIPSYGYQNYYFLKAYDGTNLGNVNFIKLYVHNDGAVLSNTIGARGEEYISMGVNAGYSCQSLAPWTINADVGNSGTSTYDPILAFQNQSVERARIYTDTSDSHKLKFDVGGSDQMVIDSSGKVGIGTSAPYSSLTVRGTGNSINLDLNSTTTGSNSSIVWNGSTLDSNPNYSVAITGYREGSGAAGALGLKTRNGTSGNLEERMLIDSSGKVGIGTSSPSHKLDVVGDIQIDTGNLVIGTSGKGIDFSATSGTGTSELLDDYEEGTFTPTLGTTGTGYTSVTYDASVSGSYTKVGRKVFFTLFMGTDAVTKGSASGGITVAGLPFTSNSTLGVGRSVVRLTASNFLADAPIVGTITENTSYIQLSKRATSVSGDTALQVADIGTGANANFMSISGSYQI